MSPIRPIRSLLLLLFVLLQCVAPLAHAHVNGNNAGQNAHIAINDVTGTIEHRHAAVTARLSVEERLSAEEQHSVVVCMPPEYRLSVLDIVQPALASQHVMPAQAEHAAFAFAEGYQQSLAATPYHHPPGQAPPV
jgi:hypothetical protein